MLSKQNLNVMLGTSGYFDELQLYQNLILMECPTNINKISKKYNLSYNKVKKYFSYLVKNNFIEQIKRGEYRITEKGITKTPVGFKQSKITEKTFFTTEP